MKKLLDKLKTNPLYKKYELFVPPAITALIVLVMIFAVIVPNIFQFFEAQNKISELEGKITFFNQKASLLRSVNREQYTLGINNSLIILPDDKEAPAAISQLYYILGLTNMTVQNITFSDAGSSADGLSFKISLELQGSLSSLTNFILELKDAPRIMRINSLEVSNSAGGSDILASVTIDAFYEPLPASITKLEQPVTQPTEKDLEILNRLAESSFPTGTADQDFNGPKGKSNPFE